jgi:TRAP-type C4-dicarboxylate transport system permease small subunit
MKKRLDRILVRIKQVETVCSVIIFGFMVGIIGLQVVLRYFFGSPMTWAEELTALLLIYLSYLTADMVYKEKGHIAIDYVVKLFGSRNQAIIAIAIDLFTCVFLVVTLQQGISLMKSQIGHTTAAALPLSKSYWTLPVPIVFLSMFLTTAQMILEEIEKLKQAG